MSGVEVAAMVAGIVSAFCALQLSFSDLRRKHTRQQDERLHHELHQPVADETTTSLIVARPSIQRQYDVGFKRLGQPFAVGDEICQSELRSQHLLLEDIHQPLRQLASSGNSIQLGQQPQIYLDLPTVLEISNAVQRSSINALHEQYQRMLLTAPIMSLPQTVPKELLSNDLITRKKSITLPRSFVSSSVKDVARPEFCSYALRLQAQPSLDSEPTFCPDCTWSHPAHERWSYTTITTRSAVGLPRQKISFTLTRRYLAARHIPDSVNAYLCTGCKSKVLGWQELLKHIVMHGEKAFLRERDLEVHQMHHSVYDTLRRGLVSKS